MKQIFAKELRKGICYGLSFIMAASLVPAVPVSAETNALSSVSAKTGGSGIQKAGSRAATDDTWTEDQPFASGTAESENFRIPAMVTLKNGDILAAADARWNTTADKGGLDTIASISGDGGNTWNYSFPFYFPDTAGYAGDHAATFIDPALVQGPDGTIYCFIDAFPTGYSLQNKTSNKGTGYITVNGKEYLALTDNWENSTTKPTDSDTSVYAYYVGDFAPVSGSEEWYAPIIRRSDDQSTNYVVDEWYNIYEKNGSGYTELTQEQIINENNEKNPAVEVQQNVYYRDSRFHVYRIGYTWVISSKDGKTWEHPRNITGQVMRKTGEDVLLVSPGRGITTEKNGDILLGDYYLNSGTDQVASMIYSTNNGKSWERTDSDVKLAAGGSNSTYATENEIVELKNGKLIMFYRNSTGYICYANITKDSDGKYVIGSNVRTGARLNSGLATNCNLSAISYSKEVNGKQLILVSCPTGETHGNSVAVRKDERINGRIYAFSVESNGTLALAADPFPVPEGAAAFQYSCLTELDDGSIALLWENGDASIRYDVYNIFDIMPRADISGVTVSVELEVGECYEREYEGSGKPVTDPNAVTDTDVVAIESGNGYAVDADIYNRVGTSVGTGKKISLKDAFPVSNLNTDLELKDLELTFIKSKTDSRGDFWQISNKDHTLFMTSYNVGGAQAFRDAPADLKVKRIEDTGLFRFSTYSPNERFLIFYQDWMRFDGYGSVFPAGDLAILERTDKVSDEESEDSILKGYVPVTKIRSGRKYLVAYIYTDETNDNAKRVIAIYPHGTGTVLHQSTKLIDMNSSVAEDLNTKYVSFTAKSEGVTTAMIDGVTYKIQVKTPDDSGGEQPVTEQKRLELKVGETFREQATVENVTLQGPAAVADAEILEEYDVITEMKNTPSSNAVPNINLSNFEFVFRKAPEEDLWTIYNEISNVYLKNAGGTGNVYSTSEAEMKVRPINYSKLDGAYANQKGTYSICFPNLSATSSSDRNRQLVFWAASSNLGFNAMSNIEDPTKVENNALFDTNYRPMMLWERALPYAEDAEGLTLGGYVPVTEIKDGGKYLIAFVPNDQDVNISVKTKGGYILNAGAGKSLGPDITRFVAEESEKTRQNNGNRFLNIKAKEPGFMSVLAGNVEYRIYVTEDGVDVGSATLLEPGELKELTYETSVESRVLTSDVMNFEINGTKTRKLKKNEASLYLKNAEFTFTSMSEQSPEKADYYQVTASMPPSGSPDKYLGKFDKRDAGNNVDLFTSDANQYVKVEDVAGEGDNTYFQISKVQSEAGAPAICFHSELVGDEAAPPDVPNTFNMTSHYENDDKNLTLYEKDPDAENTPLPGYKPATEIKSGATYLIAYVKEGADQERVTYVLYPQNGIWNSTLMVDANDIYSDVTKIKVTPIEGKVGADSIIIDGELQVFEVADHSKHQVILKGQITEDCYKNGFTGTQICMDDNKVISLGKTIPATGHQWDDGEITTELSIDSDGFATANGIVTYTCQHDRIPVHTKIEKIYTYAYNYLKNQCDAAEAEMEKAGYAPEALEELRAAYNEKKAILDAKTCKSAAYYIAAESLQASIAKAKKNSGIIDVDTVTLDVTNPFELYIGKTKTLIATVGPEDATDKTVTWSSSNPAVAKVENGVVTGVSRGTATITATAGGVSATVKVTVKEEPIIVDKNCKCVVEELSVSPQSPSIVIGVNEESGKVTLEPNASIGGGCTLDEHPKSIRYTYSIKDGGTTGATVKNGVVTATAPGTAVIKIIARCITSESSESMDVSISVTKEQKEEDKKQEAIKELVTELENAKDLFDAKKQTYHTGTTWEDFEKAYTDVQDFMNLSKEEKEQYTLEDVLNLLHALTEAKNNLPKKPDNSGGGNNGGDHKPLPDPVKVLTVGAEYQVGEALYTAASENTIILKKGWNKPTVKIPATEMINGIECKVVGIGAKAFYKYKKLKKVTLGANVETISGKAFSDCKNLNTVTISPSVKKISQNAFFKCKKIKKVVFKGKKLPGMKGSFKNTAKKLTVKVDKTLRKNAAKKKNLVKKLKKAGLKVSVKNIK